MHCYWDTADRECCLNPFCHRESIQPHPTERRLSRPKRIVDRPESLYRSDAPFCSADSRSPKAERYTASNARPTETQTQKTPENTPTVNQSGKGFLLRKKSTNSTKQKSWRMKIPFTLESLDRKSIQNPKRLGYSQYCPNVPMAPKAVSPVVGKTPVFTVLAISENGFSNSGP